MKGKTVVITGASRGMGKAIANYFAFSFDGKDDVVFGQAAYITTVVGHFGYHDDKVGTIGN